MATAQIKGSTDDGKRILLNPDGTWKYDDTAKTAPAGSYECADLIERRTDKVTGNVTTGVKESIIVSKDSKSGFGINVLRGKSGLIVIITAISPDAGGCIDDKNKTNILFRDGTRLELVNAGKFNCDSKFTLYFGGAFGMKREFDALKTKEIETMRVWTAKGYVEEDFTPENSKTLMKSLECVGLN